MMQSLRTLIVQTAELVEAEGHVARSIVVRLLTALTWQLVGALLFTLGCIASCYGIYQLLLQVLSPGFAVLLVGVVLILISGILMWISHGMYEGLDDIDGKSDDRD